MLRRAAVISFLVVILVCLLGSSALLLAGEWPQWRGPARNGLGAEDEPNLAASWPKAGPAGQAGAAGAAVLAAPVG